jgi:long-chain fatty acid transport protein
MMKQTHRQNHMIPALVLAAMLAALGFCWPSAAHANAFFIQEMSADGMAQGGAVVAAGAKPSNMFQNAANLSYLDGFWVEFTGTVYIPVGNFENPQGEVTDIAVKPLLVPHFFTSYKINDWCAVGLGAFVDFGLSITWPDDWEGSHLVTTAGMNSVTINPNVSFGPFKGFSIAVGFDAKYGSVDIKRKLTLGTPPLGESGVDNTIHLGGDAWGFGGNIGIMYQPAKWVRMGAQYRSGIMMNMKGGKADFDTISPFASRFPDQRFDAKIMLPHLVSGGVRFWPIETFSIELDAWYTGWHSYDNLVFKFDQGLRLGPAADAVVMEQTERKNFHDAAQIRIGMEWNVHEHVDLRLGFNYDGGVIPDDTLDPMLPDNHRLNPSIGIGTEWYGFYVDLAYMLVYTLPRDVRNVATNPFPGKYAWMVHDVSLTLGYHHDFLGGGEPAVESEPETVDELPASSPEAAPQDPAPGIEEPAAPAQPETPAQAA